MRQAELCIGICALQLLQGCHHATRPAWTESEVTWRSSGVQGGGEPGTKYFALWSPGVRFQASDLGVDLELESDGGGPYAVTLDQYEMHFADLRGWAGSYAAMRYVASRCVEIAIHFQGVVCRRYVFEYDAVGRIQRRVDTGYEGRRKGESRSGWAERWEGRTPTITCMIELEYSWSDDGRTVEVSLESRHGRPKGMDPIQTPSFLRWRSVPGRKLEAWRLNGQGAIGSIRSRGKVQYAARHDDAGRLLSYDREGVKVENRYDARGRILERRVVRGGNTAIVLHRYPDGPKVVFPPLREPFDEAWLVTHDANGWVSRIREHCGPPVDAMCNMFEELKRDKDGRIIWRRTGFVLANGRDFPHPVENW